MRSHPPPQGFTTEPTWVLCYAETEDTLLLRILRFEVSAYRDEVPVLWTGCAESKAWCCGSPAGPTEDRSRVVKQKKSVRQRYHEYLASSLWRTIRERVLVRDGRTCRMCGAVATTVHHTSYANSVKAGHDDSKLVSLCCPCHESIEFTVVNGKKKKNGLAQANQKLNQGIRP